MDKIKATFDTTGFPTAFYDTNIFDYPNLPDDCVDISKEQWQEFIDNQGFRIWKNGKVIVYTPPQPDFLTIKQNLKIQIDKDAEQERLKYITPGVGQSMTYQEKVNQAASYSGQYAAHLANPENNPKPNDAEYLLLASSLGIDGGTLLQVAGSVTLAYSQWQNVGAEIEKIRLKAKATIDEAKAVETAQAVYNGIQWPNG